LTEIKIGSTPIPFWDTPKERDKEKTLPGSTRNSNNDNHGRQVHLGEAWAAPFLGVQS
jgi:hypothetical protein